MLASLLAAFASGETMMAMRRARSAVVAYLAAGLMAFCGALFLIVAAYIAVAERWGAVQAALVVGIFFLVLAVVIVMVHQLKARRDARKDALRRSAEVQAIGIASLSAALPALLRSRKGTAALMAAPVVGLLGYFIHRATRRSDLDD